MQKLVLLLILAIAAVLVSSQFLSVYANPLSSPPVVAAPAGVEISFDMQSPVENATYTNGAIDVSFNASVTGPSSLNGQPLNKVLTYTTYRGDWMNESKWCPKSFEIFQQQQGYSFNITGVPFGWHTLNFTGHAQGGFVLGNGSFCSYFLEETVSLRVFVLANPVVEWCVPQNVNSSTPTFPLNFTVDHPVRELAYSLDSQSPVAISGNTTLTGLSDGWHNVTVYATDEFGYSGESGVLCFSVASLEVFPVLQVAAAALGVAAAAGLVVYLKRAKQ